MEPATTAMPANSASLSGYSATERPVSLPPNSVMALPGVLALPKVLSSPSGATVPAAPESVLGVRVTA